MINYKYYRELRYVAVANSIYNIPLSYQHRHADMYMLFVDSVDI